MKASFATRGSVEYTPSTSVKISHTSAFIAPAKATAVVSEITYSENEYVHIIDKSGNIIKEYTIEESIEWMEDMVDEERNFSGIEKIAVGLPASILKHAFIVDTPGLGSVTSKNHDITNRYVADTDYILWVINSHNLGSKAVNEIIDKIQLSGKPIIGIINKVDSDEEKQGIQEYIEKEYGNIFEDIYYVSAKNAWRLQNDEEENWKVKTGFDEIEDCIEDIKDDKEHSTNNTQYYQLQRDKEVHMKMRERVIKRKEYYDNEISTFSYVNNEIKNTIKKEIKNWLKKEFYVNEMQELMNVSDDKFQETVQKYTDSVYITQLIDDKYNEVSQFIYNKWNIVIKSLSIKSSQIIVDFTYDKDIILNSDKKEQQNISDATADGFVKGAAVGVAFAGYWAWLGPAAASVTFAGALLPLTIPCAVGGAAIAKFLKRKDYNEESAVENIKKKQEYIDDIYNNIMQLMQKESAKLQSSLLSCSDYYYEEKIKEYKEKTAQLNFDFTEPAFTEFMEKLDDYINNIVKAIEDVKENDVPVPPSSEDIKY